MARTTLAGVFRSVSDTLSAAGLLRDASMNPTGIELLLGERYLAQEGIPPRIILVSDRGSVTEVPKIGARYIKGVALGFTAYVWGAESTVDLDRYDAADDLVDVLLNAFEFAAPGRLGPADIVRAALSNVVTYGEEYQVRMTYARGVPRDDRIWRVPVQTPGASPPDPDKPQGDTGLVYTVNTTVDPKR